MPVDRRRAGWSPKNSLTVGTPEARRWPRPPGSVDTEAPASRGPGPASRRYPSLLAISTTRWPAEVEPVAHRPREGAGVRDPRRADTTRGTDSRYRRCAPGGRTHRLAPARTQRQVIRWRGKTASGVSWDNAISLARSWVTQVEHRGQAVDPAATTDGGASLGQGRRGAAHEEPTTHGGLPDCQSRLSSSRSRNVPMGIQKPLYS